MPTVDTVRETVVPQIPDPRPGNVFECVRSIAEILSVREGISGDPLDQNVTYRDLYRGGRLGRSTTDGLLRVRLFDDTLLTFPISPDVSPEFNPPPAPTGLAAVGALANVIVTVDPATYHNHAFTEIWRSGANDLGTAVKIGTTNGPASVYADNLGQTGVIRYYWARHVSQSGVTGPFNATNGTSATTGFVGTTNIDNLAVTNAKIGLLAVDTANIANLAVSTAKIALLAVTSAQIALATITAAQIALATITDAQIANATITSAKIISLNANQIVAATLSAITANLGEVTAGSIRGINVNASSHTTKGSYLTVASAAADATLNVKNTTDFPASGSGWIIDTTNDRDAFTYTGKTSTTLTGCSGVLAHNNGATIIPVLKNMVIDSATNEMRFYGDRGDGTIEEMASIGVGGAFGDVVGQFGNANVGSSRIGCVGISYSAQGVVGQSTSSFGLYGFSSSGSAVFGSATSGYGGEFVGNATKANLKVTRLTSKPSDTTEGGIALIGAAGSARLCYADGAGNWRRVSDNVAI